MLKCLWRCNAIDDPKHLLRGFFWRNKWPYALSIASIIVSQLIIVQFPRVVGQFAQAVTAHRITWTGVGHYALLLMAIGAGSTVLFGIGQFRNGQLGRVFESELRGRLFAHWERLPAEYYHHRSVGDLLNHAVNDVRAVREMLSGAMNSVTNAVFLLSASLFMTLTTINVSLTLVSVIPIATVPVFIAWFGPRIRDASREVQESLSDMAELTEESLSAIRLIKTTANEPVEERRFAERVDRIVVQQMKMFRRTALFQSFIPLMGSLSFAIALSYGGYLTVHGTIQIGMFVAFTLYLGMILNPLQQIGAVINSFQRASASMARLSILLREEPSVHDSAAALPLCDVAGAVQVDVAAFHYPGDGRDVLRGVNFALQAGQTLGIVGRTGAGKTTLVNLIPRIFDPPAGGVLIDGHDVRDISLETLRDAIGYVPQDGFLFSTSIGENIAFGDAAASKEQIAAAAADAQIASEITRFKAGYGTEIGERGVTLSGGQKQRTAMARAFLKNAPILILDDSLSAVDAATEQRIIRRIRHLRQGKTTLIVAHRLSAVRHADLIIVLEEGRVAERGTHAQLLAAGGTYADMWRRQEEKGASA